jgi:AcrR family transcriptional regulator
MSVGKEVVKLTGTTEFVRRIATPNPAVIAQLADPDEITTRILRGALAQFELIGVRRTTMEDIARRSDVGRATLYRRFPTKTVLVDAVVLAEVRRYLDGSALAHSQGSTMEERWVNGTMFAVQFLREHTLLNRLMDIEPDTILPSLTVEAGAILDLVVEESVARMRTELYGAATTTAGQERHLRTAGELFARLTLSFILTPHTTVKFTSADDVRAYVRDYLLPIITSSADRH